MTGDGAIIEVGADIYFHIYDPVRSVINVRDLDHATRVISQTLLQRSLGHIDLADLQNNRRMAVCEKLQQAINELAEAWGVKIERIEL